MGLGKRANNHDRVTPILQACALDKRSPLPRLGMAQMYCGAGQLINAATELEEALKAAPAFYDALKVGGL